MCQHPAVDVEVVVGCRELFAHRASREWIVDARAGGGVREPCFQPERPEEDVLFVSTSFSLEGVDAPDGDLRADESEDGLGRELSVELIRGVVENLPVDLVLRDVHHLGEHGSRVEGERGRAGLHDFANALLAFGRRGDHHARADAVARSGRRRETAAWRDERAGVREGGRHRSTDPSPCSVGVDRPIRFTSI